MTKIDVIIGLQWGDEGKGKMIDVLCEDYDIVARYQGGPNAGHTIIFEGKKIVLHSLPSGFCRPHCFNVMGAGVVINPILLKKEVDDLQSILGVSSSDLLNRLMVSSKASLILPTHPLLDRFQEEAKGEAKIGSTLKGIGPCYTDRTARNAVVAGDIFYPHFKEKVIEKVTAHVALMQSHDLLDMEEWFAASEWMKKCLHIDYTEVFFNQALKENKRILAEGAQGAMLDVNFGTYPFVTSSTTTTSGVCLGLGVPPQAVGRVYGVFKAYTTRVGGGPFPTELNDATGEQLRKKGYEFGSTTGRARRCGWLDLPLLNYAMMINGVSDLMLMKVDVLAGMDEIKIATQYRLHNKGYEIGQPDVSFLDQAKVSYTTFQAWQGEFAQYHRQPAFLTYLSFIENYTKSSISHISYGADRKQVWSKGAI